MLKLNQVLLSGFIQFLPPNWGLRSLPNDIVIFFSYLSLGPLACSDSELIPEQ